MQYYELMYYNISRYYNYLFSSMGALTSVSISVAITVGVTIGIAIGKKLRE